MIEEYKEILDKKVAEKKRDNYNPRYVCYCKAHNLKLDAEFKGWEFTSWIATKWSEYFTSKRVARDQTGRYRRTEADHVEFDKWLEKQVKE